MDIGHFLLTGFTFFILLSVLVLVHELGHFFAARIIGVTVDEFGFGLPPRIWGKKFGSVLYSLNWLPIGGFVKLAGEDEPDGVVNVKKLKDSQSVQKNFWARSKKERAFILLAGVGMNYLLSVLITVFMLPGGYPVSSQHTIIGGIAPGSPAQSAGLKPKDTIISLQYEANGQTVTKTIDTAGSLIDTVNAHRGETLTLTVMRDKKQLLVPIVPRVETPKGEGPIGVAISDIEIKTAKFPGSITEAVAIKNSELVLMITKIGQPFVKLVTFQSVCGELSGPWGIAKVTGQAVKVGFTAVLYLASTISLNLAFLNVLPIPALDGGRLAFVVLEKFLKRKIRPSVEASTHQIGFIILLALILLISVNDIFCPQPIQ